MNVQQQQRDESGAQGERLKRTNAIHKTSAIRITQRKR